MAHNWDEDTEDGKDVLVYSFLGAGLFFVIVNLKKKKGFGYCLSIVW